MITSSRMPYVSNEKYLELAKLDFNHVQSIHQKELGDLRRCYLLYFCIQASLISSLCSLLKANISCIVQRWWKASGFTELTFTRDRVTEIYFSRASFMFELEFSTCRSIYRKLPILQSFQMTFMTRMDLQRISSCFRKQSKGKGFIYFNFCRIENEY